MHCVDQGLISESCAGAAGAGTVVASGSEGSENAGVYGKRVRHEALYADAASQSLYTASRDFKTPAQT